LIQIATHTATASAGSSNKEQLIEQYLQHRTLLLQWCLVNAKAAQAFKAQRNTALVRHSLCC